MGDNPLAQLMAMGFSQELSQLALDSTQYQGVEVAIGWITEQVDPVTSPTPVLPQLPPTGMAVTVAAAIVAQIPGAVRYKMVFVVNTSLSMSIGKTAAQASTHPPVSLEGIIFGVTAGMIAIVMFIHFECHVRRLKSCWQRGFSPTPFPEENFLCFTILFEEKLLLPKHKPFTQLNPISEWTVFACSVSQ